MTMKKPKKGTPEYRDFFSMIGKMGGNKTKKRLREDPDFYSRIGSIGGEITRQKGPGFYRSISGLRNARKNHDQKV